MNEILLELKNIRRSYPEFDLAADFSVAEGEFFSILGPSGSGKTTLLRLIAGFDRPDTGRIFLGGADITELPPHRRRVGMVFQDYALFPHLTAGENSGYSLKITGMPAADRRKRVDELLHLTGLSGFGRRDPSSLSGGERQRVALARALAAEPLLLLFDEPFSALDYSLRRRLRAEIHDIQRRAGFTAIFVTHSQEEALSLSDRLLILSAGCVKQIGHPEEVYHEPSSPYVADFIGEINRLPVRVAAEGLYIEGLEGEILLPHQRSWQQGRGFLRFRPEEGVISLDGDAEAAVPVTVAARTFTGPTVTLSVQGGGWRADVLSLGGQAPALAAGAMGWLILPLRKAVFEPEDDETGMPDRTQA